MPAVVSRSRGRGRRTISEINMVPFIDVMLVLLIIFMVTAPLITPSVIDVPSVGAAAQQPGRFIQLVVGKDETIELKAPQGKSVPVTLRDVANAVRQAQGGQADGSTDMPVVISADRSVKYETVVKVMDTLHAAGVKRIGLSVKLTPHG